VIELGKYPYILNTGSLKRFLDNIPKIGTPAKITQPGLPSLGFKSTADRPIVKILKFIDFLSEKNEPTDAYRDFKVSSKAGSVMAEALKKAYADLFEIYPDACDKNDQTLKDFFTPTTDAGEQVVNQTVATFKVLCGYAHFKTTTEEQEGESKGEEIKGQEEGEEKPKPPVAQGVTLNVNIQITLPVTDDASVYDKIFKAIKNNILTRE
jgi:hypothetical protein